MKKKFVLFCLLFLANFTIVAQKVDLDREYIKVEYIRLPLDPILDQNMRTFSLESNVDNVTNNVKLYGFERIDNGGDVNASINFDDITTDEIVVRQEKHEKKNKEGKVIKTWYTYDAILKYTTSGQVMYSTPNTNGDKSYSIGERKEQKKTFNKKSDASTYAKNNVDIIANKFQREFIQKEINDLKNTLNRRYGYEKWWHKELFWILDSESNPEYAGHKKALEDIKNIFSKIKVDSNVKELEADVKKVEEYFNSVIPKFPKDKRKHRKMRYASYYNIAKLYYTIENFEKAKEYAQKVIDNRYDRSDGKKIIKNANHLEEMFKINDTDTRHFKTETIDSRQPKSNTEVFIIEKEPVKEITELPLTGNSEIDNKKTKKILDELELLHILRTNRVYPFKSKYLKKGNFIYGKQLHSSTNSDNRYDTIFLIKFNNKILGSKFKGYERNLVFNKKDELEQVKDKYLHSKDISITRTISRNKFSKISKIKTYGEEDFSKVLSTAVITYEDENPVSILERLNRDDVDKKLLKIIENSSNKLVTSLKYFNNNEEFKEEHVEQKLTAPLKVFFNKKTTYKKRNPSLNTEQITYNDFNKVLKREVSSEFTPKRSKKSVLIKSSYAYKFNNKKLTQYISITENITHPHFSSKHINNYTDLNSNTNAPEYEWRRGEYKFNHLGELVNIRRDRKYKEKINGNWSEWKFVPY